MRKKKSQLKRYTYDFFYVVVTEFEIVGTCFMGTDAYFNVELRDRDTDILLNEEYERLDNCFMGFEDNDSEYFEEWLKEKYNIDFEKDYEYETSRLPEDVLDDWHKYEIELLDECYHDADLEDIITDDILDKIGRQVSDRDSFYIIDDGEAYLYDVKQTYFGAKILGADTPEYVINGHAEDLIMSLHGVYFQIYFDGTIEVYEKDENSGFVVDEEYLDGLAIPADYIGATAYSYDLAHTLRVPNNN